MPRASLFLALVPALFAADLTYQRPPKAVEDVLNLTATPLPVVSPTRDFLLLAETSRYPSISELAEPMLRLAGLRINPRTNGSHRAAVHKSLRLIRLSDGATVALRGLPEPARYSLPVWSPDGRHFAFTQTTPNGIELWIGTPSGEARRADGIKLNAVYGRAVQWMPDSRKLLLQLVPPGRGTPPEPPAAPSGPNVQESDGKAGPVRTFQDLLKTPHDEALFEYYATTQLATLDATAPAATPAPVGQPAIFANADPAPSGRFLLVSRIVRPYSYLHALQQFPRNIEVWSSEGGALVHRLASLPLADRVPIDGVQPGPRQTGWMPSQPATLVWVEALDGGNPKEKVPHRDRLMQWQAPTRSAPFELAKTEHRMAGLTWLEQPGLALISDYDRNRRWRRTWVLDTATQAMKEIHSASTQDRYRAIGQTLARTLPSGDRVAQMAGDRIFFEGDGASPQGDRPYLRAVNWRTGQSEELFRCDPDAYETVVALLDADGRRLLTRRESPSDPPNYFLRAAGSPAKPLTEFRDAAPQLRQIRKQLVTYSRPDGVQLSFTLYLPPDYREGTRLPAVLWAYPREYNDPETAGQIGGSTKRFTTISGTSHLFFLLNGYAVLDGATMPVVGDPETVNNTYIEQIVASAKAAIDKGAAMRVIDPGRVGVGGHSYGAFMTGNLLAHSDLFRAGIARSGAYNRTLTPFGFQSERRTLWEAEATYLKMSPFMVAPKINEPLLLIHGEADDNPGTFPVQSERMYQAVRGNGGVVRYVTLPHESHGYAARESVGHTLWEMLRWFDLHVKNAPKREKSSSE